MYQWQETQDAAASLGLRLPQTFISRAELPPKKSAAEAGRSSHIG
jgi:hypothetical protein